MTPTTVCGSPVMVSDCPTPLVGPPKSRRARRALSTTTRCAPGSSSAAVRARPSAAWRPNTSNSGPTQMPPRRRSAPSPTVTMRSVGENPATDSNAVAARIQSYRLPGVVLSRLVPPSV